MKNRISILCFVLCCLLIISCNKKPSPTHYTISNDFRKWVDFQNGSYWVYINDNSGLVDSCYFRGTRLAYTVYNYKDQGYVYDVIDFVLASKFLEIIYIQANADYTFAIIGTIKGGTEYQLRTNANIGQKIRVGLGTYEEVEVLDSLKINNNTFMNIRHTRTIYPLLPGDIIQDYFFSKGVGLIKFHQTFLNTDSTWSLLRYHTIQ